MSERLRLATFNAENLFSRAKILDRSDGRVDDAVFADLARLQGALREPAYDKRRILELYHELKKFIDVVETRGRLMNRARSIVVADGAADWDGWIAFKKDRFHADAQLNTAQVIRAMNADVQCLVEVESRLTLASFAEQRLDGDARFPFNMLVDGNDARGIDVGLLSRHPIGGLRSHIDDRDAEGQVFSRDCLEAEVEVPGLGSVWVLMNHFKSKGGNRGEADRLRRRQAARVAEILGRRFDLSRDLVAVMGDLNDTPDSQPLRPLLAVPGLHDVLARAFGTDRAARWTHHFHGELNQLDYILASEALMARFAGAGVERRGIHRLDKLTDGRERSFPTVTRHRNSASDHAAVWADFRV